MKRLLLLPAFWLFAAVAFAADTINIVVTYTPGAATAAAGQSTTVLNKVQAAITEMQTSLTASNVPITLTVPNAYAVGFKAPADSSSMNVQYSWAKNDPTPLQYRMWNDASITVHVSDPGVDVTQGVMSSVFPTPANSSVIAIPYGSIDTQLERAISRILGADAVGYAVRARTWPADPNWGSNNVCFHSRESLPSDTATLVPELPYWWMTPGVNSTKGSSPEQSCEKHRTNLIAGGGAQSTYFSSFVSFVNSTYYKCHVMNINGTQETSSPDVNKTTGPGGSSAISCSDGTIQQYSSPSYLVPNTGLYLGTSTYDNVTKMTNRGATVEGFKGLNATLLDRATSSVNWILKLFRH